MNQVLTQSEVDALLNAVSEGNVEVGQQGAEGGGAGDGGGGNIFGSASGDAEVPPYDLTNQDRVIRGRMPITTSSALKSRSRFWAKNRSASAAWNEGMFV